VSDSGGEHQDEAQSELHWANVRCFAGHGLFTMHLQDLFHLMSNMTSNGVAVLSLRGEDIEAYGGLQRTLVLFFAVTAAVKVIGIAFISAHHSSKASNAGEPA
jgi:hypothetical protein